MINIINGDCFEHMANIKSGSVDLILVDPPYGVSEMDWDKQLPFREMWIEVDRILKPNTGVAVFHALQPFTTLLIHSNLKNFKYCWIWEKNKVTGFQNSKKRPLKTHEDICVFGGKTYNPQGLTAYNKRVDRMVVPRFLIRQDSIKTHKYVRRFTNYPRSILKFKSVNHPLHPTQKPVQLLEYLIKTYSNEGDLVLDFCMGSGSTGVAAKNTNRSFIGIELDEHYFNIAKDRINNEIIQRANT